MLQANLSPPEPEHGIKIRITMDASSILDTGPFRSARLVLEVCFISPDESVASLDSEARRSGDRTGTFSCVRMTRRVLILKTEAGPHPGIVNRATILGKLAHALDERRRNRR
jgi:hypothetical protein